MTNRKQRRAEEAARRKAGGGGDSALIAKLTERIEKLEQGFNELASAYNENVQTVYQAFSHVDMHTHIIQRVLHDIVSANASGYLGRVLVTEDNLALDLPKYYKEYERLHGSAPEKGKDVSMVAWAHGKTVEEAIEMAKTAIAESEKAEEEVPPPAAEEGEEDYETEHFGGDYGDHHNQVETAAQAGG